MMSKPVAQYSPRMLRFFLQARAQVRLNAAQSARDRRVAVRAYVDQVSRQAGVTDKEMQLAWRGWLRNASARARLWGALNIIPADQGVRLLDDGGQEVVANG